MPLDTAEFPVDVQVAFFIFGLMEDIWDGMSGSYMGKNWHNIPYFFDLYEVEDPKEMIYYLKLYEGIVIGHRAEKSEKKRKSEERKRKSSSGGGNFTHNITG
jgi:hypothetical protein